MRFFRSRRNSIFTAVLFGLIIITFIFFGDFGQPGGGSSSALTTVNGEEVSHAEYQRILAGELERYGQSFGGQNMNPQLVRIIERQVATMLVTRKALAHEAERMGIIIGDEDIREELRQIESFQDPSLGRFSPRIYEEVLRLNRVNPRQFERSIAEELASNRLRSMIDRGITVSENEIKEAYRLQNFQLDLSTARISDEALRNSGLIRLTEEEVRNFYTSNASEFMAPERRRIRMARFDTIEALQKIEISDAEIENFYKTQIEPNAEQAPWNEERARALHILVSGDSAETRREAQRLLQDLRREREKLGAGPEFESFFRQMARNQSEDYRTAFRGGDLGYFSAGENVEAVDSAIFKAKEGSVLGPISSEFGTHILYVLDKTTDSSRLENRREEIRYILSEQQLDRQIESTLARVRSQIVGRPQDFSSLLEELGFQVVVTEALGLDDQESVVPFAIIQRSFESPLSQWQAPEEFEDNIYVFRPEEIVEPKALDFEAARPAVEARLFAEKQEALLNQWAEDLESGTKAWSSLKDLGAQIRETKNFKVYSEDSIPGFERSEVLNRQAQSLSASDQVRGPIYFRDDIVFLRGQNFVDPSESLSEENRNSLREELLMARRATILQNFIEGVVEAARIPDDFRAYMNEGIF